jgi:uncharacterized protein (DUF1697 family)
MATFIGLLRAINVAGHNKVAMADLRALMEKLGLQDPRTLLQSGNLVFGDGARTSAQLETLLEREAKKGLGLDTPFMVRSAREWKAMVAANPFPEEAKRDPGHLVLVCLKDAPGAQQVAALEQAIVGREVVAVRGRQAYVVYRDGIGRSRLTGALIDRKLGTSGTGRNWNTVLKLAALAAA